MREHRRGFLLKKAMEKETKKVVTPPTAEEIKEVERELEEQQEKCRVRMAVNPATAYGG